MDIIDIRMEIIKYLKIKDILNLLSIDQLSYKMRQNIYLWQMISRDIPDYPKIKNTIQHIKTNIQRYQSIHQNVHMLIRQVKFSKININEWLNKKWISFNYLKYHLNLVNVHELYQQYKYMFNENISSYHLDNKKFKKLYLYRSSPHQIYYFALKFIVPKHYNSALKSYTWTGLNAEEVYNFLFHFSYYIDVKYLNQCVPIQIYF